MTPAQVWSDAYLTEYRLVRRMLWESGYGIEDSLANGETGKQFCHRMAERFAFDTRDAWLAANPNWLFETYPPVQPWYDPTYPTYPTQEIWYGDVPGAADPVAGRTPLYTGTTPESR